MATGRNDDEEDHFSKLPEALIIYILSLLNMEDSFKTRLLSNSWKNRWTNVDSIFYESEHEGNEKYFMRTKEIKRIIDDQWISFIDHTLMRCNNGKIKSFSLLSDTHFPAALLNKWIEHVLDKNVETLRLNIQCELPDCLFRSSSITNLELFGEGNTSAMVNLSKLKSLLLEDAYIDDAFMDRILAGSPLLENIVIRGQFWITRLNLMSPRVKTLELSHIDGSDTFEIRAPWLQELKVSGLLICTKFELVDVSSLSKATLIFTSIRHEIDEKYDTNDWLARYNHSWIPMVTKLLISLSCVPELIIGSHPIQVLSWLKVKLAVTPFSLFMCKHLTIKTYLWKFDIPGIVCLIENAPHLETLIIKVLPFSDGREEAFSFYKTKILFQDGDPHLNMPYGKSQKLKNVKIEYSQMSCGDNIKDHDGGFFDFELIEYILKGAVVLEKLVLCSSRGRSCSDSKCLVTNCLYQYISSLQEKVITTIMSITGNKADGWELEKCNNKSEFVFSNYASILSTAEPSSSSL